MPRIRRVCGKTTSKKTTTTQSNKQTRKIRINLAELMPQHKSVKRKESEE